MYCVTESMPNAPPPCLEAHEHVGDAGQQRGDRRRGRQPQAHRTVDNSGRRGRDREDVVGAPERDGHALELPVYPQIRGTLGVIEQVPKEAEDAVAEAANVVELEPVLVAEIIAKRRQQHVADQHDEQYNGHQRIVERSQPPEGTGAVNNVTDSATPPMTWNIPGNDRSKIHETRQIPLPEKMGAIAVFMGGVSPLGC